MPEYYDWTHITISIFSSSCVCVQELMAQRAPRYSAVCVYPMC